MADGRRRQVAPVRKLVAAVLGTFATFVILFGFGMRSWAIAVLGVALLALAIALVAFTAVRSGPRAWVTGIGHVHSVTEPPASSTFGRCELQIVIDAPGVPGRSVRIRDPRVPVSKWPDPGATLPIMVAIDDQRHVRILWDEVLTHAEAAASGDLPPEFHDFDPGDDDILIEQEAPPWARGGRDDPYADAPPGGAPATEDLTEDDLAPLRDDLEPLRNDLEPLRDDRGTSREEPVVMRQTPGGTIVLEGTLVDPPSTAPLPRRSRPTPGPGGRNRRPRPAPGSNTRDSATGAAAPVSDAPPAPRSAEPDVPATGTGGDGTGLLETPPVPEARSADVPPAGPAPAEPDLESPRPAPEPTAADSSRSATTPGTGGTGPADTDEIDISLDDPDPDLDPDADLDPDLDLRAGAAPRDDLAAPSDDEAILADLIATQPPARLGGSGPIAGVGITLLVTDLERSIAFYRDLLGFFEIDGGEGNAILASGATRLVLRAIREVAPINRRLVHLNLEVNDVTSFYEELLAKGVKFTYAPRAVNRGAKLELWAAAFRDPDGHGIALTQWRSRATG
ncbi:VOC family protein [Plantactinospora sp. KLBMP9567]|uniref:VOC family protein n=1 Tax=Plantactinospora sp. KLBMP9567 TaxID=3085900 RepID=UPI002981B87C|nr:VOC family protein [Plantactinospora sp. KLBMP9567]MDW5327333.1 VOC family protein [Plantactinospora sp. KLBMP9567]MDW5330693.1 VOC family protein [Plantactinospora sp. KLBMP9567]